MEFEENILTQDAKNAIRKADILVDKIERGIKFGMVSLGGMVNEKKVRESRNRYNGVGEMTNNEFINLLKEKE